MKLVIASKFIWLSIKTNDVCYYEVFNLFRSEGGIWCRFHPDDEIINGHKDVFMAIDECHICIGFYECLGVIWGVIYAPISTITLGFACFESIHRFWLYEPNYMAGMMILRPCGSKKIAKETKAPNMEKLLPVPWSKRIQEEAGGQSRESHPTR